MLPLLLAFQLACLAQNNRPVPEGFERRAVMIPMRDGVRLYTEIFTPKTAGGALAAW